MRMRGVKKKEGKVTKMGERLCAGVMVLEVDRRIVLSCVRARVGCLSV